MQRAIDILNENNLEYSYIEKSKIGFMNSVFLTEKYVVKIYDNSEFEFHNSWKDYVLEKFHNALKGLIEKCFCLQ